MDVTADRILIVASPTAAPLCTAVPVPTDGQPQWWRCEYESCRFRVPHDYFGTDDMYFYHRGHWHGSHDGWKDVVPDGPFPFTVARWAEVERLELCDCPGFPGAVDCRCGDPYERVGVTVGLVEVTGPSHHADECYEEGDHDSLMPSWCHPDAAPDCWHTPTGRATTLDVPVPCERPALWQDE